ncbi:MAG: pilus assembly PilX N-terminal domain-containing protein [Deltaproteobacteria bacterium]|nr:pilus assembly PilX N-terminal domain-containing protein [Deltaproteobacteria bacterium]
MGPHGTSSQRGFVLIMVLLLIIMISGIGLLAIRHSRQEALSTGAYVDSTRAVALVESAMAVAITDLRSSPDYYRLRFLSPKAGGSEEAQEIIGDKNNLWQVQYAFSLSDNFYTKGVPGTCTFAEGTDCPPGFMPDLSDVSSSSNENYQTVITYDAPLVGPCPPGYSCFDDQNYGWYIFGINVSVRFGTAYGLWDRQFIETARANGKGKVTIGPIAAYGN